MNGVFNTLSLAEKGLSYHLRRHQLLTSNVANASTPGYRPMELRFREVMEAQGELNTTDANHISSSEGVNTKEDVYVDQVVGASVDENSVSMERQLAKLSANSLRYRATTEMINRRLAILRYAASDGRR